MCNSVLGFAETICSPYLRAGFFGESATAPGAEAEFWVAVSDFVRAFTHAQRQALQEAQVGQYN